jgi:hypothetical protein
LGHRIVAEPELELLAPVQLNIVCFGYRCEHPNRVNPTIVADLQEAGGVAPSLTRLGGRAVIRAALFNHRTTEAEIDMLIAQTLAFGRRAVQAEASS